VWHVRNLSERWQRLPLWDRRQVCTGHCSIARRRRKSHELMIREGWVIELTGNSADLINQRDGIKEGGIANSTSERGTATVSCFVSVVP
jgi:hypothetical protein